MDNNTVQNLSRSMSNEDDSDGIIIAQKSERYTGHSNISSQCTNIGFNSVV